LTHLREFRCFSLAVVLLIVTMRVKRVPHLEKLKVPLQLGREVRTREIVPGRAGSGFLLLNKQR